MKMGEQFPKKCQVSDSIISTALCIHVHGMYIDDYMYLGERYTYVSKVNQNCNASTLYNYVCNSKPSSETLVNDLMAYYSQSSMSAHKCVRSCVCVCVYKCVGTWELGEQSVSDVPSIVQDHVRLPTTSRQCLIDAPPEVTITLTTPCKYRIPCNQIRHNHTVMYSNVLSQRNSINEGCKIKKRFMGNNEQYMLFFSTVEHRLSIAEL